MLSIGLISASQEKYYTELSREDYYTDGGEPPGEWFGGGAERMELSGQVEKGVLSELFAGFAPGGGGERLVANAGSETRRAGFDLTFNAPKSVSLVWALAGGDERREVQAAQAEAVRCALRYIEEQAGRVRFGKDGVDVQPAKLTVALFEHSTARLTPGETVPDPHLHTHAVVANIGLTEDGRTRTLDSRELLRHKMAAGVIYRAELFKQLEQRLGLTASRGEKFVELDAVPKELREFFSRRRQAIEEHLEEGAAYGRATDDAALHTRTNKPAVDRASFLAAWKELAAERGFELDFARATVSRAAPDAGRLAEAVQVAASRVTAQQSHFAARDYVRALAELVEDQGVGGAAVIEASERYFEPQGCVHVGEMKGEARFTTREMLELEERMLKRAKELMRRSSRLEAQKVQAVVESRRADGKPLSAEQERALRHITLGRSLALVRGMAGTGKTYMLEAARDAFEAAGLEVRGVALASRAAKQLEQDSGIASGTIHSLLFQLENGRAQLSRRTVLVVDEAGMVGTRQMERLVSLVHEVGAKLVLVGDDRQLQAIDAGAPFAGMRRRFDAAEMSEIRRQRDGWAREVVREFSRGEARRALRRLAERGLVTVARTQAEARDSLVQDALEAAAAVGFQETLVLTGTRAEARRLNREIQLRRRAAGELGADRFRHDGASFHSGDRVIFRKNAKKLGVSNGDRGEVVGLGEAGLTVRLDSGHRVTIHEEAAGVVKLQLGYAATTHSSQGATVERAFVLASGVMLDREASYVQASRARAETRIYMDRATAGDELNEVTRAMERSRAKDLAVDLLEQSRTVVSQELAFA